MFEIIVERNFIILLALCLSEICSEKLPDYIKPCNDVKDSDCLVKKANEVIPRYAEGDEDYGIDKLEPAHLGDITVGGASGFQLIFKDSLFSGLSTLKLDSLIIDPEKGTMVVTGNIPELIMKSKYEISGRLLIIPLQGSGDSLIKLKDSKITLTFWFDTAKDEHGKEHWHIRKDEIKHDHGRAIFKLDNLFNGDKLLGDNTNRILNEMWKEVLAEVSPPVVRAIIHKISHQLNHLFKKVSVEEMFPK